MPKRAIRNGVTMIEVLVTLSIILVLAAIAIPAIQNSRESSRKLRCANNLRTIGTALAAYQAQNGVFPSPLYSNSNSPGGEASTKFFSALTHLLPYMEQTNVYEQINFGVRQFDYRPEDIVRAGDNAIAAANDIWSFACPSDSRQILTKGLNNYRVDLGGGPYIFDHNEEERQQLGAFNLFRWYAPKEFTDGLSKTVGVSEKLTGDGNPDRFDRNRDFWYSGAYSLLNRLPSRDEIVSICGALSVPNPSHYSIAGRTWIMSSFETTFFNHTVAPNSKCPDCSAENADVHMTNGGVFAARSFHKGGVNVMLMDGSVQFISDSVDLSVWRAMGTRAGNDIAKSDL